MTIRAVERALTLLEVLQAKSDEQHPMTLLQIEEQMKALGHEQARQSLTAGMETLAGFGYDIRRVPDSNPPAYYLGKRELPVADVETIADILSASRFVTREQAEHITERCCFSLSDYQREAIACRTQVGARRTEHDIDWNHNARLVRKALSGNQELSFLYIDYNPQGIAVPRHDGKRYIVTPLALVYADDTYYMQATEDGAKAKTFRVDHMRSVRQEEPTIDAGKAQDDLDILKLTERSFSMYQAPDGRDRRVELLVEPDAIASVIDYFKDRRSCDMACADLDGTRMSVTVTVQPSPTFFGWVAQYLGSVRIIAPDDLRRSFAEACAKLTDTAI